MSSSNVLSVDELYRAGLQALQDDDFEEAIRYFEHLVENQPETVQYRLPLGLAYLLIGQEEAGQLTWAIAFSEVDEANEEKLLDELVQLIQSKIKTLEKQEKWLLADLLYQHLITLYPLDINSILKSIQTALECQLLSLSRLSNSGLLEILTEVDQTQKSIDLELLETTVQEVIFWDTGDLEVLAWVEAVAKYLPDRENIAFYLYNKSVEIRSQKLDDQNFAVALSYIDAALRLNETDFGLKHERVLIYLKSGRYKKAVTMAEALFLESTSTQYKILAKSLLLESLIHIPERWNEAQSTLQEILQLLEKLLQEQETEAPSHIPAAVILRPLFLYQYVKDDPIEYRSLLNRLSKLFASKLQTNILEERAVSGGHFVQHPTPKTSQKLRIGFLSEFMKRHSVGWLSRWIFQHYDRERFEFHVYFQTHTSQPTEITPFSQTWFSDPATKASVVYGNHELVAQLIEKENINILVDLDSLTSERNYSILALKPAPIQVSWLGYDATGLPTVDYFLADRFVLPDQADEYYTETIWRMPSTYIAVDGFEVGVPTLRRDKLNIPIDAVVYFSAQTAAKRHPDTVSCQIEILKRVPNSYLLVKGMGDAESLRSSFLKEAEAEGIDGDRLRFLEPVQHESIHRANLGIADVVLDTFPYSGATTTMETLWMGVPLVTRVGQQFTSRNSYAMLRHTGIEAGIAHSAEEYVEWGVRFGKDAALREQIKHQMWRSRQTSPLWNAKQFTRDLENAFEQMWQRYLETSS